MYENNQTALRSKRCAHEQLATTLWTLDRFIAMPKRSKDRDFAELPHDLQTEFIALVGYIRKVTSEYTAWLYKRACDIEETRGIEAAKETLPPHMLKSGSLELVLSCRKKAKEMTSRFND